MMEIIYDVTEEAFIDFNLYHSKNSKTYRKSMALQRFLIPVMYVMLAGIFSLILDMPLLFLLIPFLILSIVWVIFSPSLYYGMIKRTARKMIREGDNGSMLGEHSMVFTEEGLKEISKTGEASVSWSGIVDFGEDDSNFYLYNSSLSAYILPKKDLQDAEALRKLIHEKVKKTA
ncbi:hypothetical protein NCCP2050_29790 [Planococcus sp. NCCP-2050]|nr:hypothetical protein NCCP2050_29790 [Planococcus sp. NCCP-2050]